MPRMTNHREPLPIVQVERPRCPECGEPGHRVRKKLPAVGALANVEWRYVSCLHCEKHYLLIAD